MAEYIQYTLLQFFRKLLNLEYIHFAMKTNKTNLTLPGRNQKRTARKTFKPAKVLSMACKKAHFA